MEKYNQQLNRKKLVQTMLASTVLASMLIGCVPINQSARTSSSITSQSYTTQSSIQSESVNSSITNVSENPTVPSSSETVITSEVPTETIEPYSDIKWEPICEEGFSNYMLYNYNIDLISYIRFYGFDSFLNDNFTDYVNQRFNTNYEHVPFEITKTYFKYIIKQVNYLAESCDYDNDMLYESAYSWIGFIYDIPDNYFVDYNVYMNLYKNNIVFGSHIPSNIVNPNHDTDQEIISQLPNRSSIEYNQFFTLLYWEASDYSMNMEDMDPEKKELITSAISTAFQEKGLELYPVYGQNISYDLLIYLFPEHKEEIDEVTAQLQAEQASQESQVETAETTRSH